MRSLLTGEVPTPARHRTPPAVWLFFGGLLLLGLLLVRDYGFSIDELQDRKTGMVSLKYVSQLVHPAFIEHHADFANYGEVLAEYPDRDYGVSFQLLGPLHQMRS